MATTSIAKVMASFRQPGETLKDLKAEWDKLTAADKTDLASWYQAEQG